MNWTKRTERGEAAAGKKQKNDNPKGGVIILTDMLEEIDATETTGQQPDIGTDTDKTIATLLAERRLGRPGTPDAATIEQLKLIAKKKT